MDVGFKKMLFLSGLFHAGMLVLLLSLALIRSTHPSGRHVYQVDLVTLPPPVAAPVKEVPAAPPPPVQKPPAARPKVEVKKPPIQPPPKLIKPAAKVPPPAKPKPAPAPQEAAPSPPSAKSAEDVSAIAPAPKLQTSIDAPDFKFPYYTENIRRKIEMYWSPPPLESAADVKEAVVGFVLFSNGKIGDPKIEKSSGNSYFDQAALRAVYLANPLPPFPQGLHDASLTIHFSFALVKKS
ncbi:MAG TPA: TonB family protein [Nitrospiria bacterium]|nr:TonB family protein [Nitrospiria bacterium]